MFTLNQKSYFSTSVRSGEREGCMYTDVSIWLLTFSYEDKPQILIHLEDCTISFYWSGMEILSVYWVCGILQSFSSYAWTKRCDTIEHCMEWKGESIWLSIFVWNLSKRISEANKKPTATASCPSEKLSFSVADIYLIGQHLPLGGLCRCLKMWSFQILDQSTERRLKEEQKEQETMHKQLNNDLILSPSYKIAGPENQRSILSLTLDWGGMDGVIYIPPESLYSLSGQQN